MRLSYENKHGSIKVRNWRNGTFVYTKVGNEITDIIPHECPGVGQDVRSLFLGFKHVSTGKLIICCFQPLSTAVDFVWVWDAPNGHNAVSSQLRDYLSSAETVVTWHIKDVADIPVRIFFNKAGVDRDCSP